ncbi:MAG: GAF domain-containing protein [Byssovorax sp.]
MLHQDLHAALPDIAARVLLAPDDAEVLAARQGAGEGCSRCARALVNAADLGVDLGLAGAALVPDAPSPALRDRVLAALAKKAPAAQASPRAPAPRHPFDPSAAVASHHIGGPRDDARTREVDALGALVPRDGEGTEALLAELQALLGFSIFFVSVVRSDKVGYRVQRGLPPDLVEFRQIRREMSYCTHTIDTEAPFVVENAEREPFFRGSRMMRRYGIRAYAGVPLRTSRGVVIGTVCALDYAARSIGPDVIATLELYTEPVLRAIEGQPAPEPGGVHPAGWFARLLAVEHGRSATRGAPSCLITVAGPEAALLPSLRAEGEVPGRLGPERAALLLPGAGPAHAGARAEAIRGQIVAAGGRGEAVTLRIAGEAPDAEAWACAAGGP